MIERVATLEEMDRHWTLTDIYKANALLDMKADLQAEADRKAKRK